MGNIQIKNIVKEFKNTKALQGVSLEIKQGELVVLLGPSGCGKTTLLRIVAGLDYATSGQIFIDNKDVHLEPPGKRDIAMVFQNYAIFPHMNVEKNIAFGLKIKKFPALETKERVLDAMELMHIKNLADRLPSQLSGGQRQRVAVARALAMKPTILLMDEPLSNLDALLRLEMRVELKSLLKNTGTTTLYVTHDQVEAMSLADRIAVLYQGVIEQYSDAENIYSNPATEFVGSFIGNPPMNIVDLSLADEKILSTISHYKPPSENWKNWKLGIRAEHLTISKEKMEQSWEAKVLVTEPLGSHLHLTMKIAEKNFRAVLEMNNKIAIGDTVYLKPKESFIRWFQK